MTDSDGCLGQALQVGQSIPAGQAAFITKAEQAKERMSPEACLRALERVFGANDPLMKAARSKLQSIAIGEGCVIAKLTLKPDAQLTFQEQAVIVAACTNWLKVIEADEAIMQPPDGQCLTYKPGASTCLRAPSEVCLIFPERSKAFCCHDSRYGRPLQVENQKCSQKKQPWR